VYGNWAFDVEAGVNRSFLVSIPTLTDAKVYSSGFLMVRRNAEKQCSEVGTIFSINLYDAALEILHRGVWVKLASVQKVVPFDSM